MTISGVRCWVGEQPSPTTAELVPSTDVALSFRRALLFASVVVVGAATGSEPASSPGSVHGLRSYPGFNPQPIASWTPPRRTSTILGPLSPPQLIDAHRATSHSVTGTLTVASTRSPIGPFGD